MNEYERILAEADADRRKKEAEDARALDVLKRSIKEALAERDGKPTKESIMQEPNRTKRQKLIRENMDLFKG